MGSVVADAPTAVKDRLAGDLNVLDRVHASGLLTVSHVVERPNLRDISLDNEAPWTRI